MTRTNIDQDFLSGTETIDEETTVLEKWGVYAVIAQIPPEELPANKREQLQRALDTLEPYFHKHMEGIQ